MIRPRSDHIATAWPPRWCLRSGLLHIRGATGPVHTPPLAKTRGCTHWACGARARRPPRGPARSVPRSIRRQSDPSGPHAPPFRPSRAAFCTPVEPAAAGRLGGAASTNSRCGPPPRCLPAWVLAPPAVPCGHDGDRADAALRDTHLPRERAGMVIGNADHASGACVGRTGSPAAAFSISRP